MAKMNKKSARLFLKKFTGLPLVCPSCKDELHSPFHKPFLGVYKMCSGCMQLKLGDEGLDERSNIIFNLLEDEPV